MVVIDQGKHTDAKLGTVLYGPGCISAYMALIL